MSLDDAKTYITQALEDADCEQYSSFDVQLMGGEPLMEFDMIRRLSEWLWKTSFPLPLRIVFAPTNGTLLTEEMKRWLSDNRDRFCLGLSFDGNATAQNLTRSDSANRIDLDFFAATWPNQSVKMTISPQTTDLMAEGVIFLHEKGFKNVSGDFAMGHWVEWGMSHYRSINECFAQLIDWYLLHTNIPEMSLLNVDVENLFCEPPLDKKCSCGESLTCIDADGTRYACHLFSPLSMSAEQIRSSRIVDFADHAQFAIDGCRGCLLYSICTVCAGMNYINTGSVSVQSEAVCMLFRLRFLNTCKLRLRRAQNASDLEKVNLYSKIINSIS